MSDKEIGDTVKFGRYQQKGKGKAEKIEWTVLDVNKSGMLLISKKILAQKQYHERAESITWERSSLRAWLNGEFYDSAFTEEEKAMILRTNVKAEGNPEYFTYGGVDTDDCVYILSAAEANKYLKDNLYAEASAYAAKNGVSVFTGFSTWWLRTPGFEQNYACEVNYSGYISVIGHVVTNKVIGVRPVIWISNK